jgi:DNA replication protein DnaD
MLLLANHDDNKFMLGNELVEVKCGSFITSEVKLMERWGWSKCKTRAFLDLLQKDEMIVKKTDRKKTTINIVNYSDYAVLKTTEKPQTDCEQTTNRPRADTNNNDNNENNDNKYIHIKDMYNEICVSFPRLTVLSDKRKKAIKARLNTYSVEQIKEVFIKAEASDFLKGKNNRNWQANFDWLINDTNMAKVLDGNYDNKKSTTKNKDKYSDFVAELIRRNQDKDWSDECV